MKVCLPVTYVVSKINSGTKASLDNANSQSIWDQIIEVVCDLSQ